MTSFVDEFMPFLIFIAVMYLSLQLDKLRQEVHELKEILQQRLPPETNKIEQE